MATWANGKIWVKDAEKASKAWAERGIKPFHEGQVKYRGTLPPDAVLMWRKDPEIGAGHLGCKDKTPTSVTVR